MLNIKEYFLSLAGKVGVWCLRKVQKRGGFFARLSSSVNRLVNFEYLLTRQFNERPAEKFFTEAHQLVSPQRVSVILPVFGIKLFYFKEFLNSLKNQTFNNWQLCICDDGDPDETVWKYVQELARKDPQKYVCVRHDRNQGISAATRSALSLASGEIILFVDADDTLHKRALEMFCRKFCSDDEIDLVYSDSDLSNDLGFRHMPSYKPGWSPELLQTYNYINHLVGARKNCLNKIQGELFPDEFSGAQDWDFCWKVAAVARRISHIPLVLYHWRMRPGSIAHDGGAKPWAQGAGMRVQQFHLKTIHPWLTLNPMDKFPQIDALISDEALPEVVFLSLINDEKDLFKFEKYRGRKKKIFVRDFADWTQRDFLTELKSIVNKQSFYLFMEDLSPEEITGDVERSLAFAIQPRVSCVWPFKNESLRLAYTTNWTTDKMYLASLKHPRSVFSNASSNVLTGPLRGLFIDGAKLILIIDKIIDDDQSSDFLNSAFDSDQCGAFIGLYGLTIGFRNVSCHALKLNVIIKNIPLGDNYHGLQDPYI